MIKKEITFDEELSRRLLAGVEDTAKLVGETMGPAAGNVILADRGGVHVTKDGITVIQTIWFDDMVKNAAAELLRQASAKTNDESGDGTTGTCILAATMFKNGLKHIGLGHNKTVIRRGMQKACKNAIEILKKTAKKVESQEQLRSVALIASNHDAEIADAVVEVLTKVGENGTVKVEPGNTSKIETKIVDGMQVNGGYASPYFATNDKIEAELENPWIVLINKDISNINDLLPVLQRLTAGGPASQRPIVIVADTLDGDALSTLVLNKMRGLQICGVKSPSYGENRKAVLQDIAILTGGLVAGEDSGVGIEQLVPDIPGGGIGTAKKVIVTKDSMTIIGGAGKKEDIRRRIESLKQQLETMSDPEHKYEEYEVNKIRERLAKLDGGVAIISVGAKTEVEMREKKDLVDDALCATRSARAGGIVPGGGRALFDVCSKLQKSLDNMRDDDEAVGFEVFINALSAPIRKIIENAGESPDLILSKLKVGDNETDKVWDASTGEFVDPYEAGIIDPANVIKSEIENAVSVAGLLLTCNAANLIVEIPERKKTDNAQGN